MIVMRRLDLITPMQTQPYTLSVFDDRRTMLTKKDHRRMILFYSCIIVFPVEADNSSLKLNPQTDRKSGKSGYISVP